jgi:serine/threonine protein kinase
MSDAELAGDADTLRVANLFDDFCEALRRGGPASAGPWLAAHPVDEMAQGDLRVIAALHDAGVVLADDSRVEATQTWAPDNTLGLPTVKPAGEDRLGDYYIERLIGAGGMGEVYLAEHLLLGRQVAIKLLPKDGVHAPERLRRFLTEIRAQGRLGAHPNLAVAHDAGEDRGRVYLVLEYVPGTNLQAKVAQSGPLSCDEALNCIRQTAEALAFAHRHGIVHRDLKPSNLMLTPQGQVKLLDLGLAQLVAGESQADDATRTQAGIMLGTPDYVAPEQAQDASQADARSDLYSLGCTWYYLLTGRAPFAGGSAIEKLRAHAIQPPPSVLDSRPDVPPLTAAMLEMLLAKRPEDRYQSAEELLEDLGSGGPVASVSAKRRTPVHRRRALGKRLAAVVALALLAIGGFWYAYSLSQRTHPEIASGTGSPSTASAAVAAKPGGNEPAMSLVEEMEATMRIEHFRTGPADEVTSLGHLGEQVLRPRIGDRVAVRAEFSAPCFAYLLAVNPDASCQLLVPESGAENDAAQPTKQIVCPEKSDDYLTLDDAGCTAFVLVAMHRPLPTGDDWAPPIEPADWRPVGATCWSFDGRRLVPLARQRVGTAQHGPAALADFCRKLQALPEVAGVRAIVFDVLETSPATQKDEP